MNKYIKTSYQTAENMVTSNLFWNKNHNIVNLIKKEQKNNKYQFYEFGKVSETELNRELAKYNFSFPAELINVWLEYGGGELWETENILYPIHTTDDLVETVEKYNKYATENNFDTDYFIFATDTVNHTAFHKQSHNIKTFRYNGDKWIIEKSHKDILDWFSYLVWSQYNALVIMKE